jgi:hypothetical protein
MLSFSASADAKCQAVATAQQMLMHHSQSRRPNAEMLLMWSERARLAQIDCDRGALMVSASMPAARSRIEMPNVFLSDTSHLLCRDSP